MIMARPSAASLNSLADVLHISLVNIEKIARGLKTSLPELFRRV